MAGEPVVRITRSIQFGAGTVGGTTETIAADTVDYFSQTFGIVTASVITMPVTVANIVAVGIVADKDCTLDTNSPTDDSFTLKANKPLIWTTDDPGTNPLTVDVTDFRVTTTIATTLKIGIAHNEAT